ncbi:MULTISPECIES: phosphomannomutase/phosphoglucomutase [Actinopolyspora]|uniref:Phosphomannomutase n=1 Tax=Actinopolyspora saharensis TaxID=995062 RepID=A0A1H1E8E7_9ACTN|nr:phosphomannomutase/phosphoglucomutase [Actinopolyspora saharensis]NHD18977.1 phosphomannomutase/phosphoglucomutase [Actinopolyspora sp. BKK2]NHE78238.1 phosphomannomutase/phosphoglucomutase [Actinopolyspora sp. BKK1]SDQ85032.1 phosphomannomutase [Actinopolyspora saharensis]
MRDLSGIVKAYDIRGLVGEELNAEVAREVGAAFTRLVGGPAVVVGHDMRESSPELAAAFSEGVTGQGIDVVNIGLASTDMLYFASGHLDLPGAMFTASHNPPEYNGIKLCRAGAAPVGQDSGLSEIKELVGHGVPEFLGAQGSITERDMLRDYADFLRGLVDLTSIRPLRLAVDAGNGMAGHTVPSVLEGLPIELVPMYFELDGTFPNHEANPLKSENLEDLRAKVREVGADAGLAFDGDADRCFVLDAEGAPVAPSAITALIATRELKREPGATVIHNLITSRGVPEIVRENGGKPLRTRVGHSFIKQTMAETGAIFGGEHSAHYYFRDFWRADSGMLAALHVLAALGEQHKGLAELMSDYSRYVASGEVNSRVDDQTTRMRAVIDSFRERNGARIDELDGLTVELGDGSWFNLRPSNTEPVLRLNVEAADSETMAALRDEVLAVLRE